MKMSGIYGIKNTANGKWYVGQSVDLEKRRADHFTALRGGYNRNGHLQAAFVKYGQTCFEFRVIEECGQDVLDVRESAWISHYRSVDPAFGYNKEFGGNAKKTVSAETRQKISASLVGTRRALGHRLSDAVRKRLSEINTGKRHSEETKLKMSIARQEMSLSPAAIKKSADARRGKVLSPETRQKISSALRGKPSWNKGKAWSPEARRKFSESAKTRQPRCGGDLIHVSKNGSGLAVRPDIELRSVG